MTAMPFSRRMRRWKLGLKTLFGKEPAGYFIPYRYASETQQAVGHPTYPAIETMMEQAAPTMKAWLTKAAQYQDAFASFGNATPPEPRWQQSWFPRLDGMMAYVFTREFRPNRIVEIGSGHSTRFYHRAIRDGELATDFHAIDPAPRADIAKLPITIERTIVQKADPAVFARLAGSDILSIDSSHILMPGTDVDLLFSTVIPILPSGTIIHIHDITLPDDYPEIWQWRGYNEQQGVASLLAGNGFEVLWSSAYATTRLGGLIEKSIANGIHLPDGAHETSLWLRKK
ncbi:class I SAM-dependent methyltransferase [Thalassospira sp. CH_XMU1448-2]|uniref:class I SAM-dependent methyltransferase n=1 Tax=Thalassospira sp. CH_XMU1448-2 TaxID=3107773 RepID=UPI003008B624